MIASITYSILIVEDNEAHCVLIERAFEMYEKYNILFSDSVKSAVEILSINQIDIVVTDWKLPDGEGYDLIEDCKYRNIPVIIMTGFGNEAYAVKAIKAGAYDYIVKSNEVFLDLPHIIHRCMSDWNNLQKLKEKEKQITENEKRYRSFIEKLPLGVFELNSEGAFLYLNSCSRKYLCLEKHSDISRKTLFDFIHPNDFKLIKKKLLTSLKYKNHFDLRVTVINAENHEFPAEIIVTPIFNDGNYLTFRGIIQDITEKMKYEEQYIKDNNLRSLGILAGGIAHDFNNILSSIMGSNSLAKLTLKNTEASDLLNQIEESCKKATDLTRQLLTFSKGGSPVYEEVDIKEVIKNTSEFVLSGSNIKLILEIDNNIERIPVDKWQFTQLIKNIIQNSLQAMLKGGAITIKAKKVFLENAFEDLTTGKYLSISISDQGKGIKHNDLCRIFDPYYTTKKSSNGLGLSICYSIVKKHNGKINIYSELNIGTQVNIYLPVLDIKKKAKKNDINTDINEKLKTGRIMVVDDDEMIRSIFAQIFKKFGYQGIFCENGEAAIKVYSELYSKNSTPDLLILDLTIPGGINGIKCFQEIKKINKSVIAILTSGYIDSTEMNNYIQHGFFGILNKPFNLEQLISLLNKALASK